MDIKVDALSTDYIIKELKEDSKDVNEKELERAITEMLQDCDNELINLIAKYL